MDRETIDAAFAQLQKAPSIEIARQIYRRLEPAAVVSGHLLHGATYVAALVVDGLDSCTSGGRTLALELLFQIYNGYDLPGEMAKITQSRRCIVPVFDCVAHLALNSIVQEEVEAALDLLSTIAAHESAKHDEGIKVLELFLERRRGFTPLGVEQGVRIALEDLTARPEQEA